MPDRTSRQPEAQAEVAFTPIGHLDVRAARPAAAAWRAFWIEGYAGGLFVPFTDATSGHETYGGGRYLLDTIKSADLGSDAHGRPGRARLQLRLPPVVRL